MLVQSPRPVCCRTYLQMATIDDLKDAIKDTLQQKGTINKVKAKIRAQIFGALGTAAEEHPKPEPAPENVVINELIREYLIFNGYRYFDSQSLSQFNSTAWSCYVLVLAWRFACPYLLTHLR